MRDDPLRRWRRLVMDHGDAFGSIHPFQIERSRMVLPKAIIENATGRHHVAACLGRYERLPSRAIPAQLFIRGGSNEDVADCAGISRIRVKSPNTRAHWKPPLDLRRYPLIDQPEVKASGVFIDHQRTVWMWSRQC